MIRWEQDALYSLIVNDTAHAIRFLTGYIDSTPRRRPLFVKRAPATVTTSVKQVVYGLAHNLHNAGGNYQHESQSEGNVRLWLRDLPCAYGDNGNWDVLLEHAQHIAKVAGWTLQELWDACADKFEGARDYTHVPAVALYPLPPRLAHAER